MYVCVCVCVCVCMCVCAMNVAKDQIQRNGDFRNDLIPITFSVIIS